MSEQARAPAVVVGPAEPNDAGPMASIERMSFSDPWSEQSFRDLLGRDAAACFVAREDGIAELAGYVVVYAAGGPRTYPVLRREEITHDPPSTPTRSSR